jgi:hypothetical protein
MAWDQQGGAERAEGSGEFGRFVPPQPSHPPYVPPAPPMPPAPLVPLGPADPLRAVAVGLLNLTGLGLGYALLRRWLAMAVCWIATAVLLLVALPADPDGVSGGVLTAYVVFLALAALHGAFRGLRTPLAWPPHSYVAIALALVLLAVPVGGVVLYDGARDEATEQMLLGRLDEADRLVKAAKGTSFDTAEPDYRKALGVYRDLKDGHLDSRAAKRVPDSLSTYYSTIGSPYDEKKYCEAIAPLKYLRTLPGTVGEKDLGSLATWPDDRLATSLYECGVNDLASAAGATSDGGDLGELLTTFPKSRQAAKVEPAVSSMIDKAAKGLKGKDPCSANVRLNTLSAQASVLPGEKAGVAAALSKDAAKADRQVQAGTYACGVDEYKSGDFSAALDTLNGFVSKYKNDKNRPRAKKIAIAAEIAKETPAAGKHLPSMSSGGSISVTVSNDSPDEVEILYTGPVTGSFKLKACGSCSTYSSELTASFSACKSNTNYPKKTISLPAGTTYFLHKSTGSSTATVGTDTAKLRYGYIYTECAYVVSTFGTGY